MFSRLLGKKDDGGVGAKPSGGRGTPPGTPTLAMKANAQRYFSRGVDCNSKFFFHVSGDCHSWSLNNQC